jgi:hypothetical protein
MERLEKTFTYAGNKLTYEITINGLDIYANEERDWFLVFEDDCFKFGFSTDNHSPIDLTYQL